MKKTLFTLLTTSILASTPFAANFSESAAVDAPAAVARETARAIIVQIQNVLEIALIARDELAPEIERLALTEAEAKATGLRALVQARLTAAEVTLVEAEAEAEVRAAALAGYLAAALALTRTAALAEAVRALAEAAPAATEKEALAAALTGYLATVLACIIDAELAARAF